MDLMGGTDANACIWLQSQNNLHGMLSRAVLPPSNKTVAACKASSDGEVNTAGSLNYILTEAGWSYFCVLGEKRNQNGAQEDTG
jgi:hypothetical protein